jgi:hypothetical protein
MRFCINCGSELNNERFCTKCGADNGEATAVAINGHNAGSAASISKIDVSKVLHWMAILSFAVLALFQLNVCLKASVNTVSDLLLRQDGIGFVSFCTCYFAIGMWGVIRALHFILYSKKTKNKNLIAMAVTTCIIILASLFFKQTTSDSFMGAITVVLNPYVERMPSIILLSILTAVLGVVAIQKEK